MNALMRRFRPEQIRELVLVVLIFLVVIFFLFSLHYAGQDRLLM